MLSINIAICAFLYRVCSLFDCIFVPSNCIPIIGRIKQPREYRKCCRQIKNIGSGLLLIDSPGGFISGSDCIINAISTTSQGLYSLNVRMCGSAATFIYLSCEKRFATKNSFFMFHHCKTSIRDFFKNGIRIEKKILKILKECDNDLYFIMSQQFDDKYGLYGSLSQWSRIDCLLKNLDIKFYYHIRKRFNVMIRDLSDLNEKIDQLILSTTSISKELLAEKIGNDQDWYISSKEAKNLGICHEIIKGWMSIQPFFYFKFFYF